MLVGVPSWSHVVSHTHALGSALPSRWGLSAQSPLCVCPPALHPVLLALPRKSPVGARGASIRLVPLLGPVALHSLVPWDLVAVS